MNHIQVFNLTAFTLTLPDDIRPDVVANWMVENFRGHLEVTNFGNLSGPGTITVQAREFCRLNAYLADTQANADLLRRRSAEVDAKGWANVAFAAK